jgi:hypothetical protein
MRRLCTLLVVIPLVAIGGSASASTLFLDTWGVGYGSWTPSTANVPSYVAYYVEDWAGDPSDGFLDPGWGGDDYDVEAVYAGYDDDYIYLAVVTGFPMSGLPFNGDFYEPGDIAIDTDLDSDYDIAVDTDASGTLRLGNLVWENPSIGGNPAWGGVSDPLRVTSWTQSQSIVDWSYSAFDGRYAIEAVISRSVFDPTQGFAVHWTMGCGNDAGDLTVPPVPEPASVLLLGLGLVGGGLARRRRRS